MSETPVVNGAAPAGPAMPPLYAALEPVAPDRHRALKLRDAGFGFAAAANALPLAAEEFATAARTLPIVFAATAPHLPVALTGLASGENRFVGSDGAWREGTYVPAYLRRYPFFLLRTAPDSEELVLCLDRHAAQLSESDGTPMFDAADKATEALERAFAFSRAVEQAMLRTRAMSETLAALGLLKPAQVQFQQDGRQIRIDGFFAVDRPTLLALPAEKFMQLRDQGWLEPVFAHLLSIGGVAELARGVAR
jgi:hypothetical protein